MNAVEIEEEVSKLAAEPFDAAEFAWAFLRAFGNKDTAIKRLKASIAKSSGIPGGVLQQRNIHLAVAQPGTVDETLAALKASPKTAKGKVRFVLATDGEHFAAHDLESDDPLSCTYPEFADHFGFFLPLAGIAKVRQLTENPIDIKATGHLNKLYLELIRENEEWGSDARRHDLNQFVARIIFCLFAEDTGIFTQGEQAFTSTIKTMSDGSNTHEVVGEIFRAMDTKTEDRAATGIKSWATKFPYVNGGLFNGLRDVPRFSKMARSYLLSAGELDWKAINPDIFGSMIQGIAEKEERTSLGMHYTSVPNILKVLDPLFLNDLREQLEQAGDNPRKLLNLRKRIASIRVFDPACGSGNFLIVGYIKLREIEAGHRGEQYLLIKSPPASGKSRALMFIALDKLHNQGLKQALIIVPERSIGGSFADEPLSKYGFWADWTVKPQWNLCNVAGIDDVQVARSKVTAVKQFLAGDDRVLVCTHATFRFAVEELGIEQFDQRLLAVDEFHHVSANPDNVLGSQLKAFIARDKTHVVAMTGSYFRGDAAPVLVAEDEAKFVAVTYTYYEQLNGYDYLKSLDIGYFFYSGTWVASVMKVLDPAKKTILHIPNVNSRESTKRGKHHEVNEVLEALGEWKGVEEETGFQLVQMPDGRLLKVADLVDDDDARRSRVIEALKNPKQKNNRDLVDIIIALGMAKEGFDWIWCEHALTVGYRNSLTEIIQIIGRATRDAPGKERARFTNLIAEPDASEDAVVDAINDTLKAIAASLLMEQVLAPRFNFTPKNAGAREGFEYGDAGYQEDRPNVGFNEATGQFHIELKGLVEPESAEAARICKEDLNEVIAAFVQDKPTLEKGLFDKEMIPEEITRARMGKIVRDR